MPSLAHATRAATPAAGTPHRAARAAVVRPPRPRLTLGRAGDEAEHQADHSARKVLQTPARASAPHRPAAHGATRDAVRRAIAPRQSGLPETAREEGLLSESLEERLLALQGGGVPLPGEVRADMEARFGLDFGAVRIHTDAEAAQLADAVGAHAFALGEHLAFGAGRFAPAAAGGRFLLAHELAHVAQFRAQAGGAEQAPLRRGLWSDLYDSVADTLGDIADWGMEQVREFGWQLVRSISPALAQTLSAILDEGLLPWLGRQLARAWDAYLATLRALVPFEGPRQLIDLFAGLVERAAAIAAALAAGDCAPLMAAIGELKGFVVDSVGVAWERLSAFLQPIGDFFGELWAGFGAPALQWLQDFGGAVWQGIQDLGADLWEWIRPLREAAERVWGWFHDSLFGASEGDEAGASQGGLLGWLNRKAGEAWDWVREQTRPVWQPVAEFAGQVAELIPPSFVRAMGEQAQHLAADLDAAQGAMGGGEGVPAGRETLAGLLPSVEALIATLRGFIVGAGEWLSARIGALASGVTSLLARLTASSLLAALGAALAWLAEALDTLSAWARDQVAALFARLVQVFDALTPFIELVLEMVRKLISIYGDLLQLPLLILGSIWQRVPACIREPVEAFVQTQILARIPVFGQFFSDPEWWPRVQQTALTLLRRVFVDGDIMALAWEFFQAVLRLMGLPPELVVQVLAKAVTALGEILANPLGFLVNLLRAMGAGFMNFFANIGRHLLTGLTGWLFGAVREAGIEPPTDLSPGSVFRFVMAVLGVSVANVFERLGRRLDPALVERLKGALDLATGVWSFVQVLITEGVAGLWRLLTERLSGLWTTVFEGVMSFISTRVIAWASLWLVSFFDWSGITPTINTLIALYRAIQAAIDYLREMLEIVARVLDGVVAIARGTVEAAAAFLEDALATSLPVAIGFLAYQAGLGRLSQRLAEILGGLRERVNEAIDWLIERALRLGQASIDLLRRGASAVRSGVRRLREWWQGRADFRAADGSEHSVYIEGSGSSARVMVASRAPLSYEEFIGGLTVAPALAADQARAAAIAIRLDQAIATAAADNPVPGSIGPASEATTVNHAEIIDGLLAELSVVTARFMPVDPATTTPTIYGPTVNGFGSSASVQMLAPIHRDGAAPTTGDLGNPLWNKLAKRKHKEGVYYVKGHLLNENLGGPGNTWSNLTPLTIDANSGHKLAFENAVKQVVNGSTGPYEPLSASEAAHRNLKTVNFVVTARYGQPARTADITYLRSQGNPDLDDVAEIIEGENAIPVALDCTASELLPDGSRGENLASTPVPNTIDDDLDHYATRPLPTRIVYLNDMTREELLSLDGIGPARADAIIAHRPFLSRAQLQAKVHIADGIWAQMQATPGFHVRIYKR